MQRALEVRGVPTVSVTVARDVTERLRPPRALFVPFQMGGQFGPPFHAPLQRRVVLESLAMIEETTQSGEIRTLPVTWAQARREAKAFAAGADGRAMP